jgi:hypothetical protein
MKGPPEPSAEAEAFGRRVLCGRVGRPRASQVARIGEHIGGRGGVGLGMLVVMSHASGAPPARGLVGKMIAQEPLDRLRSALPATVGPPYARQRGFREWA